MADEKKAPNADENALMMNLMILRNTLVTHGPSVKERLRKTPNAWRDLCLLVRLVTKTQDRLLDTMPERRTAYYYSLAQHAKVAVELPGPAKRGRYIMIDEKKLAAITEAAMCGECAVCMRDGRDVKRCLIREALLEVAPPEEIRDSHTLAYGCEYRDIASALVGQQEMTI